MDKKRYILLVHFFALCTIHLNEIMTLHIKSLPMRNINVIRKYQPQNEFPLHFYSIQKEIVVVALLKHLSH
jgi:hypothetical protein